MLWNVNVYIFVSDMKVDLYGFRSMLQTVSGGYKLLQYRRSDEMNKILTHKMMKIVYTLQGAVFEFY